MKGMNMTRSFSSKQKSTKAAWLETTVITCSSWFRSTWSLCTNYSTLESNFAMLEDGVFLRFSLWYWLYHPLIVLQTYHVTVVMVWTNQRREEAGLISWSCPIILSYSNKRAWNLFLARIVLYVRVQHSTREYTREYAWNENRTGLYA